MTNNTTADTTASNAREQGYVDQHRRDSQELRQLCAERYAIKAERDTLRAQLEAAEAEKSRLTGCLTQANCNAEEFERKWYLSQDRAEAAEAEVSGMRARMFYLATDGCVEGFVHVNRDVYDFASEMAELAAREEPNDDDLIDGFCQLIDAARTKAGTP